MKGLQLRNEVKSDKLELPVTVSWESDGIADVERVDKVLEAHPSCRLKYGFNPEWKHFHE